MGLHEATTPVGMLRGYLVGRRAPDHPAASWHPSELSPTQEASMSPPTTAEPVVTSDGAANHAMRWWILAVLGTAQLMVILDNTIVNIALPTAQHSLGFSNADNGS